MSAATEPARQPASPPDAAAALAWVDAHRACFGWSTRAWARPWRDFVRTHHGLHVGEALELGAGPRSSLAPLLLGLAERVECSVYDGADLPAVQALNAGLLDAGARARLRYSQHDLRALEGRWDLIAMKSVLGGVFRLHESGLADVQAALARLIERNLKPGGLLVTLDNGRTALAPLLARRGAARGATAGACSGARTCRRPMRTTASACWAWARPPHAGASWARASTTGCTASMCC
ncbi:class I SAM-dependent methyltransferase [Ottowia sp.]|uniref:class I SAM-dependent methyltransferase n=1 Tax=Ottowia sp. TaxID=1898956 RepID=UPI0025ECB252|nr:class I SAM-dependent methyltransferase [Ottowia sp.]